MLGQPLDLAVDVRLDSSDDSGNACFEAEVYHGDARVDSNRVRVIVVSGGQGQDAVVRIRSSVVVDEPVVGVVLRTLCGQKTSRRYDFLTDFPVETHAAAVPTIIPSTVTSPNPVTSNNPPAAAPAPAAPPPAAPAPAPAPVVAPRTTTPRAAPAANAPASEPMAKVPRPAPAPKPVRIKEAKEPAPAPKPVAKAEVAENKPRLKLESADAPPEPQAAQLKSSSELLVAPSEDPQKRAAAAAIWRELNNLPVDNPQEKQRLVALEAEAKTLKALLAKNEADFKMRLEKLENNRFDEGLVYALIALLLAAIAAAVFWWNRARQRAFAAATAWAHQPDPDAREGVASLSRPASLQVVPPPNTLPGPTHDPDVDESLFEDLKKLTAATLPATGVAVASAAAAARVTAPAPLAAAAPSRGVYSDEFLDVQQHADFFVSLGQYDQAIGVLKKSIDESAEVNPLAYLELLKIYHTLGRQAEYNLQRDVFNRTFNCELPAFTAFAVEGRALEAYPEVLHEIEKQWGTLQVLDVIEAHVYRDPAAPAGQSFDLAAYRELLLLYAMARSSMRNVGGKLQPMDRSGRISNLAPLSAPAPLAVPVPSVPMPLELDIPVAPETSFTQPMLLMPEPGAQPPAPEVPAQPAVTSYRQPLDLDLDLNLDFSNSELQAMKEAPDSLGSPLPEAAPARNTPPAGPVPAVNPRDVPLDLDLGLDLDISEPYVPPAAAPAPAKPPVIDSNMLEFDLFDPKIEAKISPKNNK